jgi:hypothetical protein
MIIAGSSDLASSPALSTTELLILPDGRVLVHNLTPTMATIITALNPADEPMEQRAAALQSRICLAPTLATLA